jgi:hypothetical protein
MDDCGNLVGALLTPAVDADERRDTVIGQFLDFLRQVLASDALLVLGHRILKVKDHRVGMASDRLRNPGVAMGRNEQKRSEGPD